MIHHVLVVNAGGDVLLSRAFDGASVEETAAWQHVLASVGADLLDVSTAVDGTGAVVDGSGGGGGGDGSDGSGSDDGLVDGDGGHPVPGFGDPAIATHDGRFILFSRREGLIFFVTGSGADDELGLMEVLAALVEAYHIVTKKTDVSEQHLMKHYANYCLAVDDIVSPNGVGPTFREHGCVGDDDWRALTFQIEYVDPDNISRLLKLASS